MSSGADREDQEARALMAAAAGVARLDERLRLADHGPSVSSWFIRAEALGITAAEGRASDEVRLCTLLAGGNPPWIEQADRTACDLREALFTLVSTNPEGPLSAEALQVIWSTADRSNQRRRDPAFEHRLEMDCAEAADFLESVMMTPDPWTAAAAVRRIWTSSWFFGQGRRIALLLAPTLIRRAFAAPRALVGISRALSATSERTQAALQNDDLWPATFFRAVASSSTRSYEATLSLANLRDSFLRACGPQRSNDAVDRAINLLLVSPVMTSAKVAETLLYTSVGAQKMLNRLAAAGVVVVDNPKAKSRLFICRKAMNL